MLALQEHRRPILAPQFQVAEHLGVLDQFALQLRGHFVALGHDVQGHQAFRIGQIEGGLQLWQVGRFDHPGLVGQDVQSGVEACEDGIDFRTVAAGEDDYVAGPFRDEASKGVSAGMDFHLPGGWPLRAGVERGDSAEVRQ